MGRKLKLQYQFCVMALAILIFGAAGISVQAKTINLGRVSIYSGNTASLKVPGSSSDSRYQSTSSDKSVALVEHGVIIAKKAGNAVITTVDTVTNDTYITKVTSKTGKFSLKADTTSFQVGEETVIYPVLNMGVFSSISYSIDDSSIAKLTRTGNRCKIIGKKPGTVKVTATVDVLGTEKKASISLKIKEQINQKEVLSTKLPIKTVTKVAGTNSVIPVNNPVDGSNYTAKNSWTGDYVYFGAYEQDNNEKNGTEPILWRVLEVTQDSLLLLSEYGLESRNVIDTYKKFTWETSSARMFLNQTFYNAAFSKEEKQAIRTSQVTTNANLVYQTWGGRMTADKVFLLSVEEVTNPAYGFYPDFNVESNTRTMKVTPYALRHDGYRNTSNGNTCWWLRSMGLNSYYASYVYTTGKGTHTSFVGRRHDAIRPAIRVKRNQITFIKGQTNAYYTLKAGN